MIYTYASMEKVNAILFQVKKETYKKCSQYQFLLIMYLQLVSPTM